METTIFLSSAALRARGDGFWANRTPSREQLEKIGGVFDINVGNPYGLCRRNCTKGSPCPLLVLLYARMGIHRYNFLKGRKFEVTGVRKYVHSTYTAAKCYYITLDAKEPAQTTTTTFQTQVSESSAGKFLLSCTIARIRGETNDDRETKAVYIPGKESYFMHLPEWPQENPFENYCPVKEPELQDIDKDWIHLYLQLAVAITDLEWYKKRNPKEDFDDLEFLEVATAEGLNAKNATFYIRYKDLYQNDDVDRVALVRRRFEEDTGFFSLEGQVLILEQVLHKRPKIVAHEDDTRCSTLKGQILSSEQVIPKKPDIVGLVATICSSLEDQNLSSDR